MVACLWVCVWQLDAMYITDAAKLMSGCLSALTAMVHLELPHINVLTKCDLADMKAVRCACCNAHCGDMLTVLQRGVRAGPEVPEPQHEFCITSIARRYWATVPAAERGVWQHRELVWGVFHFPRPCAQPVPCAPSQIEDYSMVSFVPLNINKDKSVEVVLGHIDNALQFGEDAEPRIPKDMDEPAAEEA